MRILPAFFIFITISCQFGNKKNDSKPELNQKSAQEIPKPEIFISELPSELRENSGIIIYDDLIWTFNDSGGKNKIYGIDLSGEIKKEVEIEDAKNVDWEDIAQDKKHIYIGDFGNNAGTRDNQIIYKIEKKDINKKKTQKVKSKKIKFQFKDQNDFKISNRNTPFDCEAMIIFNDTLYIFTKDRSDRTTTVYKMSKKKGDYKISPLNKFNVDGLVTGADISPDKTKLALIGHKYFVPILWIFSDFEGDDFFRGDKIHSKMETISRAQTEGICFMGNDSLLISCEQTGAFNQQVFLIDLTSEK